MEFLGETRPIKFSDEKKREQWEFTVKMYCIIKDLMAGNKNLPDQFEEESDPQVELEDGSVVAFPRKFVSEVVEQETDQIIAYIKETLDYAEELITPKSQIYVTGGGLVNMRGSREYLSEKLGRSVKIPMVKAARLNNPRYSNALGLMDQVFDAVEQQAYNASSQGGALNGLKNIFKK